MEVLFLEFKKCQSANKLQSHVGIVFTDWLYNAYKIFYENLLLKVETKTQCSRSF